MQRLSESQLHLPKGSGFTLIELLIVVAIIAILAAIAVPNFLEAQTRAKVTRAASDMRTIRTGLESYRIDSNKYPETDYGAGVFSGQAGAGMDRVTTPISYLSSVPPSPFKEENIGGNAPKNRHCNIRKVYLYLRAEIATAPIANSYAPTPGNPASFDQSYQSDRRYYALHGSTNIGQINANAVKGHWALKSVGPNNVDDVHTIGVTNARSYDPTNGTVSAGDLVIFSDVSGFAGQ